MRSKLLRVALAIVVCVGAPYGSARSQDAVDMEKLYQTEIGGLGSVEAALMPVRVQGDDLLIIASQNGNVVAVDPATGSEIWRVKVPTPPGEIPLLNATPSKVGKFLFVAYGSKIGFERQRHLVSVIDLSTGELTPSYPTLELHATKPANGGGVVVFNPPTALSRAALVNAGRGAGTQGMLYVAFGNVRDVQPWHGWIFEIDIDAWKREGPDAAISSVFLSTPESDCPGDRGGTDMICGGGVWNFAGPQIVKKRDGYELLVTTGNGELNLNDRNYAQSVLRLTKGLKFDPECDPDRCAAFDPISPSDACMESCKNIFIPRLMPDDPPLRVASGRCDGKTFLGCLAANDWDLGANGALQIRLGSGSTVIVQPGKEGGLYLFDAKKMGRMYDRNQIVAICGTPEDPCGGWSNGMIRAQPVVATVDGQKVIIVPTFIPDRSQPAGVVARKILTDDAGPYFEPLWEAPRSDSREARERFRGYPSLAFLTRAPDGERYVWVVDTTGDQDILLGIRVADGTIVVRQQLQGTVDTVRPAHRKGVIYVTSQPAGAPMVLEAFRIRYQSQP
jgi:hypothetical protein